MKQFLTVLKFELGNYIKNKTYMITTILLGVLLASLLFLPRFIDLSGMIGNSSDNTVMESGSAKEEEAIPEEEKDTYILFDQAGVFEKDEVLDKFFKNIKWQRATSADEVKQAVQSKEAEAGFVVTSLTNFDYYVFNKTMEDGAVHIFTDALGQVYEMNYCEEHNLNYEELAGIFSTPITYNEQIIGKDMQSNFFYCYIFVILIFMMIIMYGVMIATSVTSEKSNRSIEVLVTSTSPNSLIFGKVIAGAVAGICQIGFILGAVLISYQINRGVWNGALDMFLHIPISVLVTFAFFGIGGYLFYAFLYGAVGALVSKTEDINKTAGGIQMVIMIVYFVVLIQLNNVDGIIIKIASFLPFSSYSAMFARVAMGTVATWEIGVSFAILAVSVVIAGLIGAKVYRMGTLRYGNPIKFTQALKSLSQK